MRILVIADAHGEFEKLSKLAGKLKGEDFDLVIFPGDFTDMFNIPEGYSQTDIAELVLQKILAFNKPAFTVPGNHDPFEIVDMFEEYNVNLHNKMKSIMGLTFIGFGGASTPFNTKFEPSEEEIKTHLEKIHSSLKGNFVLVTHSPPYNTKADTTAAGEHVGSKAIREFIEKTKPILAICAHIHESGSIDTIGDTVVFYPGPIYEGKYGIADIGKTVKCEIKTF